MLTLSTFKIAPDVAPVNIVCYKGSYDSEAAVSSRESEAKPARCSGGAGRRGGAGGLYFAGSGAAGGRIAQRALSTFSRQGRFARGGGVAGFRPADRSHEKCHGEGPH